MKIQLTMTAACVMIWCLVQPCFGSGIMSGSEHINVESVTTIHHGSLVLILRAADDHGVLVVQASPAKELELNSGEVITEIDSRSVDTPDQVFDAIRSTHGKYVQAHIISSGKRRSVSLKRAIYLSILPPKPPDTPIPPSL